VARIAGRKGALYANITSGGTAEPIAFLTEWSLDFTTNKIDVTAMQDTNMVYVGGLPDAAGSFSGWYDTATAQLYTAAVDGVARKFYLYPTTDTTTQYWFGTMIADFNVASGVGEAVSMNGSFAAASVASKVG
jgi:hypothetical protein